MTPRGSVPNRRPVSPVDTIEAYEDDGAVVLFDAENPLAWVETTRAVSLADQT